MDTASLWQLVTFTISVIGLVLSVLNYRRDRSDIKVWSEIQWHQRGKEVDALTPCCCVRIANLGRRPAVLLNLVMQNSSGQWMRALKAPAGVSTILLKVDEALRLLDNHALAQNSAVRLLEGDVLDLVFWTEDAQFTFIDWHQDSASVATSLYIEDVAGKRIRVRNDARCLNEMVG